MKLRFVVCLGAVGVLTVAMPCLAQTPFPGASRLSIRLSEIAIGAHNPGVGEYALGAAPDYILSVSPQCVGARRCPLFIFLPGAGYGAREVTDWLRPVAEKYGMLLLAPTNYAVDMLSAALQETLSRFAIDPSKIAIVGRCASGQAGMALGIDNLDVFSRIAIISGQVPTAGLESVKTTAEFFVDAGFLESEANFMAVQELRRGGHAVKHVMGLRGHEHQVEDYDFLGRWLHESWSTPEPAARTNSHVVTDSLPLLTTEALSQMTAFWASFRRMPDSIRTTGRRSHLREVIIPVGERRPSIVMTDIAALAVRYPSVATALQAAGLTTLQHEAYRVALISAQVMKSVEGEVGPVAPNSATARNMEFMDAHPETLRALAATGIWRTP